MSHSSAQSNHITTMSINGLIGTPSSRLQELACMSLFGWKTALVGWTSGMPTSRHTIAVTQNTSISTQIYIYKP